ncbi:hypothetical protein Tco_0770955 [Tanacetum coccineum]|uniref:Uncharacterized protein n=1 Tax=Tanacetum coccineum TaxID=301880 RepID=A0ABQ4ZDN9_9ASTR
MVMHRHFLHKDGFQYTIVFSWSDRIRLEGVPNLLFYYVGDYCSGVGVSVYRDNFTSLSKSFIEFNQVKSCKLTSILIGWQKNSNQDRASSVKVPTLESWLYASDVDILLGGILSTYDITRFKNVITCLKSALNMLIGMIHNVNVEYMVELFLLLAGQFAAWVVV